MHHPVAMVLWVTAAAVVALSTRNPIYLLLLLAVVGLCYRAAVRRNPRAQWGGLLRLGVWIWAITIPFNALSAHLGRYVLFTLPRHWPIIGGPITLEASIFGFLSGLSLVLLLSAFATFNTAVEQHELLRLVPAAFYQVGMVATIAVTFVPVMTATFADIRQAQTLRGHRFRGIRDLLPLLAPLLATALERSIQLAEAMEARGYGSGLQPISPTCATAIQAITLGGLLSLIGGLFARAYYPNLADAGGVLVLLGTAAVLAMLWLQGRRVSRTHFKQWHWDGASIAVAATSVLSLLIVVSAQWWSIRGLAYYPYPPSTIVPNFEPLLALAILLLLTPALVDRLARPVPAHAA